MSSFFSLLFFFWNSPHPRSTLFPYTTLFRSGRRRRAPAWRAVPLASRFPRMPKRLVYLDNAATTPVRPEVLEAMLPYLGPDAFGNPSSPHRFGRAARAGVEEAKRRIAAALGAD